jgi:hypothetical protein
LDDIRTALAEAVGKDADEALPHLREAADRLTALIDESMAEALLSGKVSLRSAGAAAGLTENAVPPRLARTQTLGAYANEDGRVTAAAIERAKERASDDSVAEKEIYTGDIVGRQSDAEAARRFGRTDTFGE